MNQHQNPPDPDYDDAELSTRYHAIPKEQPAGAIDKAIIKSARESVRKEKKRRTLSPFTGWLMPLATAFSVIVVVGLLRLLPEDRIYQLPAQPKSPELLEEEGAVAPLTGKQSDGEQKAERTRLQGETAPKSAPLNQAVSDITSDSDLELAGQQPTNELRAKAKAAAVVREDAQKQVPPAAAEEPPERDAALQTAPETAQQWIEHISELIGRDEIKQARIALEEFEKRYPDHPGISDLNARLARTLQ